MNKFKEMELLKKENRRESMYSEEDYEIDEENALGLSEEENKSYQELQNRIKSIKNLDHGDMEKYKDELKEVFTRGTDLKIKDELEMRSDYADLLSANLSPRAILFMLFVFKLKLSPLLFALAMMLHVFICVLIMIQR